MATCPVVLDRTGRDVHAEGERIRAHGPVTRVELPGGFQAWSITSYQIGKAVLTDPRFSKNAREHWPAFINGEVPEDWELITWVVMDNMNTHDGADHDRLRKLVSHAFTVRQVEAARPMIEKVTGRLLDAIAELPAGEPVDVKAHLFYPLAATVICDLFGVPEEARSSVLQGSVVNSRTTNSAEEAEANLHQWHEAMSALVEAKRREPGEDLTTLMIQAREGGRTPLTDEELVGTLHLMFGAGTETVSNVLAHAVLDLLTHPDQLDLVRSGSYGWDAVFQETVRKEGAVAQLPFRYAVEDVEIGGVTIAAGDLVLMGYSAMGRDPEVHGESAAEFDITREDKSNLGFGFGPHRCLGMPLATMQAVVALPALFERFPQIRMAVAREELEPQGTFIMNGFREVPVLLTAAA